MDVINYFKGFNIECFQAKKQDSKLDILDFEHNMLLYFDLDDDNFNNYIFSNHEMLFDKFEYLGVSFLYLPKIQKDIQKIENVFHYYLPYFNDFNFNNFQQIPGKNAEYLELLFEDLGYKGQIKSGFIFKIDSSFYVIESAEVDFQDLAKNPIDKVYNFFFAKNTKKYYSDDSDTEDADCFYSRRDSYESPIEDPYENLDDETREKINLISQQLKEIKSQGQLLFVLPILKKMIENTENEIDLNAVSGILIDEEYRILLPYFNFLEIPLSHLTKAVYILFYNNPNGINIKELHLYKDELKKLYINISNQLDHDKLMQSIEDVIDPNSKSIYTHISRIKSAFYKVLDKKYADNYIIDGDSFGQNFKYITISRYPLKPIPDDDSEITEIFF